MKKEITYHIYYKFRGGQSFSYSLYHENELEQAKKELEKLRAAPIDEYHKQDGDTFGLFKVTFEEIEPYK